MDQQMSIMVVDDEMIVRESLYHWFKNTCMRWIPRHPELKPLKKWEKNL